MSYEQTVHRKARRGTVTATTNPVGTFYNLDGCQGVLVTVTGLTGETVGLKVSTDGATFSAATTPINVTTNATVGSAALTNGTYWIPWSTAAIQISKSATTESATITILAV